jgi:archaellin
MTRLVEMFAAAILVATVLAIVAIATGHLPSHTG